MKDAIAEPRSEVQGTAPKIVSFEIPMDKIGEVIGPKGKVINTLQQETGADINVDDDGVVGTVTIGSKDGEAVAEARRRIEMILDPPKAEGGAIYPGKRGARSAGGQDRTTARPGHRRRRVATPFPSRTSSRRRPARSSATSAPPTPVPARAAAEARAAPVGTRVGADAANLL